MIEENMLRGSLTSTQEAKGAMAFKGETGMSAYELAVKNGYQGTEQEWIDHFGLDLTGYLKTSDIIDNTWQGGTKKALSAEMGKGLNTMINTTDGKIGLLDELDTTDKTSIVNAINEVFGDNNGKGNTTTLVLTPVSGSLSTGSWVNCTAGSSVQVEKGTYLIISSVTLAALGSGLGSSNVTINGDREDVVSRNTIPLANGLASTANSIYVRDISSTQTIAFNIQVYLSASVNVAGAVIYLVRIK